MIDASVVAADAPFALVAIAFATVAVVADADSTFAPAAFATF